MSQAHENLLEAAKKAVDALFSDTSVALIVTQASLEELREHIDSLIEAAETSMIEAVETSMDDEEG